MQLEERLPYSRKFRKRQSNQIARGVHFDTRAPRLIRRNDVDTQSCYNLKTLVFDAVSTSVPDVETMASPYVEMTSEQHRKPDVDTTLKTSR